MHGGLLCIAFCPSVCLVSLDQNSKPQNTLLIFFVCKLQVYEALAGGLTSTSSCIFLWLLAGEEILIHQAHHYVRIYPNLCHWCYRTYAHQKPSTKVGENHFPCHGWHARHTVHTPDLTMPYDSPPLFARRPNDMVKNNFVVIHVKCMGYK